MNSKEIADKILSVFKAAPDGTATVDKPQLQRLLQKIIRHDMSEMVREIKHIRVPNNDLLIFDKMDQSALKWYRVQDRIEEMFKEPPVKVHMIWIETLKLNRGAAVELWKPHSKVAWVKAYEFMKEAK